VGELVVALVPAVDNLTGRAVPDDDTVFGCHVELGFMDVKGIHTEKAAHGYGWVSLLA